MYVSVSIAHEWYFRFGGCCHESDIPLWKLPRELTLTILMYSMRFAEVKFVFLLFLWWLVEDSLSKKCSQSCLWTEILKRNLMKMMMIQTVVLCHKLRQKKKIVIQMVAMLTDLNTQNLLGQGKALLLYFLGGNSVKVWGFVKCELYGCLSSEGKWNVIREYLLLDLYSVYLFANVFNFMALPSFMLINILFHNLMMILYFAGKICKQKNRKLKFVCNVINSLCFLPSKSK